MTKATQKSGHSWKSNNKGKDNESNESKKSNDNDQNNKSTSHKFCPHSANGQQSVACDVVREHVTNKTQQQCNQGMDAVKSLRDLQSMDMDAAEPQRQISAKTKPEKAAIEQQTFNVKCEIKLQEHDEWEMTFKRNLNKAHALIYSHMSPTMESRVKAESDFDSEAKGNPVKPLS